MSGTRPAGMKREPFLQGDSWQLKLDTKINVFHWSVSEKAQRGGKNWKEEVQLEEKKYWLGRRFCLSHLIQANWISLLVAKPFGNDVEFTVGMQSSAGDWCHNQSGSSSKPSAPICASRWCCRLSIKLVTLNPTFSCRTRPELSALRFVSLVPCLATSAVRCIERNRDEPGANLCFYHIPNRTPTSRQHRGRGVTVLIFIMYWPFSSIQFRF